MMRLSTTAFCLLVAGCNAGASAVDDGTSGSVLIHQIQPVRGRLDDIVTAFGQATAGPGGARALTLPVDALLVSIDVVPGQRVRAGQRLAQVEPGPAARNSATQARTSLTLAIDQRDRTARLLVSHLASNEQMAQAEKTLSDARAAVNAQTMPSRIDAPAIGTVTTIDATRGRLVAAGSPVISFSESTQVAFVGGIEPADMQRVGAGNTATLVPIDGGKAIAARVNAVAGEVNPVTRLVDVTLQPSTILVAGMAYRATIVVGTHDGWLVPADAIVGNDGARMVWQVNLGKAHAVPVTVIGERGAQALVEGAIDPDRPLVTMGAPQLGEGMQVRPEGGP
jgi:RND family efflux transporter MFP subunit